MQKKQNEIVAIIPAAGEPKNKIILESSLPDTMLPINGKPVVGYILEDLLERSIKKVVLILNIKDTRTEKYVTKKFGSKLDISIIYNKNKTRNVGYSIYLALKYIKPNNGVLIYLGDTIYKGKLKFDTDFLVASSSYESSQKWCFVEKSIEGLRFINKPKEYSRKGSILCGLYFFKNGKVFIQATHKSESSCKSIELSDILEQYAKKNVFKLIKANGWYDCGNIENYYKARIDFLKIRNFNTIKYDDLYGHITKSGSNREKIIQEINWYQNIPDKLKIFSPRLISHTIDSKSASYSIEFYGYQSLADFYIFNSIGIKLWQVIISRMFDILNIFKEYKVTLPFSLYHEIYYKKTISRVNEIRKQKYWSTLLAYEHIYIDGKKYKNVDYFLNTLENSIKILFNKNEMSYIHGDLCMSNILFDPHSRLFKFIDPRGNFGETSIHGDLKYDIAKLRHSFVGLYDFIVSDLFELKEFSESSFFLKHHNEEQHQKIATYFDAELIKRGYDLHQIKFIEGILFISMIPLHDDSPARQKAMYITGIRLLNENLD